MGAIRYLYKVALYGIIILDVIVFIVGGVAAYYVNMFSIFQ